MGKRPLLLYLSSSADPGRFAIGPALAAAALRAGWAFECYYDARRRGRHFGGGDTNAAEPAWPSGSLVAGGRHADQVLRLATAYDVVALGDPGSVLWPALDDAGAQALTRSTSPGELFRHSFDRLGLPLPSRALLLEPGPFVTAPYLYPAFFIGPPALGLETSGHPDPRRTLEELGIVDVEVPEHRGSGYAEITSELAKRHASWGRGILLGDPELVAAQLPKAARLHLLPLYGQPQTDVLARSAEQVRAASEPVYGRQYDDHDFFELARLGHGLQVLDPSPPFDAAPARSLPPPPDTSEPDDAQLTAWADDGVVLVTLLFWSGMIRELDCVPRIIDLVAETGLRAGLLLTAESFEHGAAFSLELLSTPAERGGVLGLLEPLLASTGRGIAAESLLAEGALQTVLADACASVEALVPPQLRPRGWWPLLDTTLVEHREPPIGWRSGRPVVRFTARRRVTGEDTHMGRGPGRPDVRSLAGALVRRAHLESWLEERRPFDEARPGPLDPDVAAAVRAAGFSYMWSKAGFGTPRVLRRDEDFVALSLTAGNWDGWSPFYTVSSIRDLVRAERRLARSGPGWLVGTIDSPLWLLPGEVLEHGSRIYRLAKLAAGGGRSGKLVNVTPNVVARYARLLDASGRLSDSASTRSR